MVEGRKLQAARYTPHATGYFHVQRVACR